MIIEYNEQSGTQIYNLMASSIIPRPIAWIVTKSEDGVLNLAPFSYFAPISSNPPSMMVSIGHKKDGTLKDTLKNIKTTGVCTVCIATKEYINDLQKTAHTLEYNESEIEKFNIDTQIIDPKYPPMVEGVPVAFCCDFHSTVPLDGKTIPTIVTIKKQFIKDDIVQVDGEKYSVDFEALNRIARDYGVVNEVITTPKV